MLPGSSFRLHGIPRNTRNRRHLKGGSHARTQCSPRQYSITRRLGLGASGSRAGLCQSRRATRLFLRLLRLLTLRLRALWLLRARVFLQRHLPGHGSLGRLGLWPRLGRTSLCRRRWRKLSRGRRRPGQSQQLCTRRRRGSSARRQRESRQRGSVPRWRSPTERRPCHSGADQRAARGSLSCSSA